MPSLSGLMATSPVMVKSTSSFSEAETLTASCARFGLVSADLTV